MRDAVHNQTPSSPHLGPREQGLPGFASASEPTLAPGLSVVIPVYNSETILPELVSKLLAVLADVGRRFEVVLVNDGSGDQSWHVIEALVLQHGVVRGINLMRNYGQHNALLCGIRAVRFDIIVTMDDDLQHPPEEIHKLLAKFGEGHDVVYGATKSGRQGLWREVASRITRWVLRRAMQVEAARDVSPFRMIRTPVCKAFGNYRSPFVSIDVLLSWGTNRFAAVPVAQDVRQSGASTYTFVKLVS